MLTSEMQELETDALRERECPYPAPQYGVGTPRAPRTLFHRASDGTNPFSVSFIQPGAIPYLFNSAFLDELRRSRPDDYRNWFYMSLVHSREARTSVGLYYLADTLQSYAWHAQIVGPHGTGKSTLMAALADVLVESGHSLFRWALHDRQRILPSEFDAALHRWIDQPCATGKKVVFLDGFEQLSWWRRFAFRRQCQTLGLGLLLSTHMPVFGLPVLFRTGTTPETTRLVVEQLLDDSGFQPDEEMLDRLYLRCRGNVRDILFALYDEFERKRIFD